MSRIKGSGIMGPVRSVRLPRALELWFEQRLAMNSNTSSSKLLVRLLHGGLRLQDNYMTRHFEKLASLISSDAVSEYAHYCDCLRDTFGHEYVAHIEDWLIAEEYNPQKMCVVEANR